MRVVSVALAAAFAAVGAAGFIAAAAPARADSTSPIAGYPDFEIVESAPIETSLDHPNIRNATEVWIEMIRGARRTLDFAEFYATSAPGEPLEDVIAEVERAVTRGVKVRFFHDRAFAKTSQETIDRLSKIVARSEHRDERTAGVREIDFKRIAGGVHHAKYFIVDGEEVYLGSQNFDWRALKHIQELGVRVRQAQFARTLQDLFNSDWGAVLCMSDGSDETSEFYGGPRTVNVLPIAVSGDTLRLTPVMSPNYRINNEDLWDEPRLAAMIDSARTSVSVQVLTYKPVSDSVYWDVLESAMRRAAARGVRVRLIASDWCKRRSTIPYLKSLALVPNIEVRMMTIPEWSGGFIPYARVVHAKYMVVDGHSSWIGTSNWERSYFYESRNVGVIAESAKIGGILADFFDGNWTTEYAYAVRPEEDYKPPRIGE